jgi:hypothetical protein
MGTGTGIAAWSAIVGTADISPATPRFRRISLGAGFPLVECRLIGFGGIAGRKRGT